MSDPYRFFFVLCVAMFWVAPFGVPSTAQGQIYELVGKIENPKGLPAGSGDNFGWSAAAVGNNLLVGAFEEDTGAKNTGSAYLFDRQGNLLTTYRNPDPTEDGWFGAEVAAVGENILISGSFNQIEGVVAGAAYLFDQTGNLLRRFDNPSPDAKDRFGEAFAVVGDNLWISALGDGAEFDAAGRVYVFDQNGDLLKTITNPMPEGDGRLFGLVMDADNGRVLIGNRGRFNDINGATAHLYDSEGTLLQTFFNPSVDDDNFFGRGVALIDDKILVAANFDAPDPDAPGFEVGTAFLFNDTGELIKTIDNPSPENLDWFSRKVGKIDDEYFLINASFDNTGAINTGALYIYDLEGNLVQEIFNPDPDFNEHFGESFATIGDDLFIGVNFDGNFDGNGVNGPGAVYVYARVPEPSTAILAAVGVLLILLHWRTK